MTALAIVVSTCGYIGFAPFAPGTVGSIAGLGIWWVLGERLTTPTGLAGLLACALLGVWAAGVTERHQGGIDPGIVVVDEVVGMLVSLAFVATSPMAAVAAFLLFRAFDIVKPFPARHAERLPGGWGIMADDVIAGLYANLVVRLATWGLSGVPG